MYSLGEIEAECRKAAKGVGLTWGLAEEAGLIARHLSEFKLPGSDAIYMTLKWIQDNGLSESQLGLSFLKKKNQNLNGLLLGVTLLDRLVALIDQDLIIRDPVIGPLAVVGAILRFQNEKYYFSASWVDCQISLDDSGFRITGTNINPQIVNGLRIAIYRSIVNPPITKTSKSRVKIENWHLLMKMAHKTYVPESARSRLLGAGAGENEND